MARRAWRLSVQGLLASLACLLAGGLVAATISREDAFRPLPPAPALNPSRVSLGRDLFHDTRLSGDGTVSCASCHNVADNGASHRMRDQLRGRAQATFNTPTVFNAALNFRLNWQGGFRTLEEHALASLRNPAVMRADPDAVLARLRAHAATRTAFRRAYGRDPDEASLLDALASYQRTLLTTDSRFDRWLQGDDSALDARELRGYRSFVAVGCVSCHQGVNVGGNLFQRSGVFEPAAERAMGRLRVPSLRNVAATAPYFHDGSAATLPEAVDAMARAQLGTALKARDIEEITAFLHTLSGRRDGRLLDGGMP